MAGDMTKVDGGVMLAKKWTDKVDPVGWWMSEKLDGVRAYWNGEAFYSRQGNKINAPEWFTAMLPEGVTLDGELFIGRGMFDKTISAVRKDNPIDEEWEHVTYQIFDCPSVDDTFEQRMFALCELLDEIEADWADPDLECPFYAVEQVRCRSYEHFSEFHSLLSHKGAEGTMLRHRTSPYERKRSGLLLKVKDFKDTEAIVDAHQPGTGKHEGRMGALHCHLKDDPNVCFKVGTGFDDSERDNAEKLYPAGTEITIRYQELTKDGKPRFPSFVGVRDYE